MVWRMWVRRTATVMMSVEELDLNVEGRPLVGESLAATVWMVESTLRSPSELGPRSPLGGRSRGQFLHSAPPLSTNPGRLSTIQPARPSSPEVGPKVKWLHTGRAGLALPLPSDDRSRSRGHARC